MRRSIIGSLVIALALSVAGPSLAKSRIKDIVEFEGVRENVLMGVGIVTGLNGTGDNMRNAPNTRQALEAMYERMGTNIRDTSFNPKNSAMVTVTAKLPPFASTGMQIDVTVSASGDAKSLLGGTLMPTSLRGPDGQVYAVADGSVQTGSVSASGASGSSVTKGVPTAGRIASGARVERVTGFQMASMTEMNLALRNADFTTAQRVTQTINNRFPNSAYAKDPGNVVLRLPAGQNMVGFVAQVENLELDTDTPAKVIIDEVAGVIVMGDMVRISTVAIAQGNLTITVQETPQVSQPAPFSRGETTVTSQSALSVDEERGRQLITLKSGASLSSLVNGLNALGVTPRDMISILQAIKAAGALQADIEVM